MITLRALALLLELTVMPASAQTRASIDDKVIKEAVRATVAEMPKLERPQGRADFGTARREGKDAQAKIDRAFEAAEVPDCLHAGAGKHVAGSGSLGGLLLIPSLIYAASTGKCK